VEKKFIYIFSKEPTGTHMLLLNHVRPGSKVLDVGCAIGYLGEYLATEKQCEVWGIESDRESFEVAQAKKL
jgi:2-polyprenyl-3-methyl-5-hydroxy-6-metoxy-1,4-benzoquinol methylase